MKESEVHEARGGIRVKTRRDKTEGGEGAVGVAGGAGAKTTEP